MTLHGGRPGYSTRILTTVKTFQHATDAGVTLRLVSPDGDQGFPGAVTLDVTYSLTDNNDFRMDYRATIDKDTVVNFTNHTYYETRPRTALRTEESRRHNSAPPCSSCGRTSHRAPA